MMITEEIENIYMKYKAYAKKRNYIPEYSYTQPILKITKLISRTL